MSFFFDVYGPFDIARVDGEVHRSQPDLWNEVRLADSGLDIAIGCYMFCIRNGDSVKPWYVGKTIASRGFLDEAFAPHKLEIYRGCLAENRGRPQLFLFPMMTGDMEDSGRFSRNRSAGARTIDWLEKTLMGMALQRNDDIWNQKDTTLPRGVTVRGIMGRARKGRPYNEVVEARKALLG